MELIQRRLLRDDRRIIGRLIERIYFVFIGHNYCTQNEVWLLRVSLSLDTTAYKVIYQELR